MDILRDNIIDQAKFYISKVGEFYPFGSVLNRDGTIAPLGVYLGDDNPESIEVIDVLEKAIRSKLKNKEINMAGIGTDVLYKPANQVDKMDAIQVRILTAESESKDYYLTYEKKDGEVIYGAMFSEPGTLKLN